MNKSQAPLPNYAGPSQAEAIAKFACRMKYTDLTDERCESIKMSILDSLACAISSLGAPPIKACLAQAKDFGSSDSKCTLIGGGQSNVVYAASYNTALIRYLDFMGSYLSGAEICHPSDNIGAVLATSEYADCSGKEFLTALAVAYQVEAVLTASAPFMAHGFDLTTQLAFSLGAGVSKVLGLDESKTSAAIEICGTSGIPLLVLRNTPISQWKGLMSSQMALSCVHAVFLAYRGVTGPKYVIEGPNGLAHALGRPIHINWDKETLDCFDQLSLKNYNSAVPTQSAIFCMLELCKAHPFDPNKVISIRADVFQNAYDFTGGGKFGPKNDVYTREDADHSLPYLLAVAALDGDVKPAQLNLKRIIKPDVQSLLRKVEVRPDNHFTARYPLEVPSRITIQLEGSERLDHEVKDYPGFPTRPFSWNEVEAKFDNLVGERVTENLRKEIKAAVASLESIQVKDIMKLLSSVKAS